MKRLILLTLLACAYLGIGAQTAAVKTNLLYDATTTPNIGAELKVGSRSTVQLFYGLNPWKFSDHKRLRHWSLMPEYRYWLQQKGPFQGWFTGLHALGGEYNVAGIKLPLSLFKPLRCSHYEGWYAGAGITLGHAWQLSDHWLLEAAVGLGYAHAKYSRYENEACGDLLRAGRYNYVGPTKLALNLAYAFGSKKPAPVVPEPQPQPVVVPAPPTLTLAYITPQAEPEKARSLSGQAYLDFRVNKTVIDPDYRNNKQELDKVMATISAVRHDENTAIQHISIHGYASPEGNYQANARLAEGRANAFKDYVQQLIDLPPAVFTVTSTPEDWDGLLAALDAAAAAVSTEAAPAAVPSAAAAPGSAAAPAAAPGSPSRSASTEAAPAAAPSASRPVYGDIIAVSPAVRTLAASPSLSPDEKERQLKQRHPADWSRLLKDVFPALRHSDYTVSYTIRPFTIEEARQLIHTKPQQLSLNEMFLVAQTYAPGSEPFNEVFEIAVRMYPDDPTANLNAAITALATNRPQAAERYLLKAGDSPEAERARQVLAQKLAQPDAVIVAE